MIHTFPNNVYNLDEITFIAGSYKELYFYPYSSASVSLDARRTQASWLLTAYDEPDYVVLNKQAECYNGYFVVKLLSTDTINLRGRYIQKPLILGSLGYDYRLEQGIINIIPACGGS